MLCCVFRSYYICSLMSFYLHPRYYLAPTIRNSDSKICLFSLSLMVLFCCLANVAQCARRDSLVKVLSQHTKNDTAKITLYAKVAMAYANANSDSAILFGKEGQRLEEKLSYPAGKAACMLALSSAYVHKNQPDSGILYNSMALDYYQKALDTNGLISAYFHRANLLLRQLKYEEAIKDLQVVEELCRKVNNMKMLVIAYDNLGSSYLELGNNSEALKNYLLEIGICEQNSNREGLLLSYSSAGRIYSVLGNHDKAREYIGKSLACLDNDGNVQYKVIALYNAALVYSNAGDHEAAIGYLIRGIKIADSCKMTVEKLMGYLNLAEEFRETGNLGKAAESFNRVLAEPGISSSPDVEVQALKGLGAVLVGQQKYAQGIVPLQKANSIYLSSGQLPELIEVTGELTSAYKGIGDFKNALKFSELYHNYKDSLDNKSALRKIEKVQFDFAIEKKQAKIEILEKSKDIEAKTAQQRKVVIVSLLAIVGLLAGLVVIFYRATQKEKRLLNEAIAHETAIQEQANELEKLNEFNKKTFSVISHDLRGPISSMATTLTLIQNKELDAEEMEVLMPEMTRQMNALKLLMDNLLNWAKGTLDGSYFIRPRDADLNKLVTRSLTLFDELIKNKNLVVDNSLPADIRAYCDEAHIDIVIRNLISNAIKFTNPGGRIQISAIQKTGNTYLVVADNGVGMNPDSVKKLFLGYANSSTFGTIGEKGVGIGLKLSHDLILANHGDIHVTSQVGTGTAFTLVLPASKPVV